MAYASFLIISGLFFFQVWMNLDVFPVVWPDEVLFFSPALSFATNGHLQTDVLNGLIPGMESKTLWMPPLYLIFSGFSLSIFPDTLTTVRIANVIIVYLTAFGFYLLLRRESISEAASQIAFASILWEPLLFRFGTVARMEGLTAFFFILSLLFATNKNKSKQWYVFLAGVSLSFSFLSHPIGASFGLVTLFLVWRNFGFKTLPWFVLGGVLPILCWMYYIHPNWEWFEIQFGAQLTRKRNLLETFTLIDKIKVFSFGFGFPKLRLALIAIELSTLTYISYKLFKTFGKLSQKWILFWIWILSVLLSLYTSSEGWYVFHILFPLAFGMALLYESENLTSKLAFVGILLSLSSLLYTNHIHWYRTDSNRILESHFQHLDMSLANSKSVYLQALPDPYFYLRKNRPDMNLLEFIPGELDIPSEAYIQTIKSRDSFVFYDDQLINHVIKDYLNESTWNRQEWEIPVPGNHWLHYKTIVYTKK
ncbi:glycosyltransferase family 39 protein [Leptospira sp. 2 VSF19]|uniref:Glycosyltransferase family 39 protein n=1 Tax=Leptospira soteropolitanensis TaxID=2950025 RepID=A0AAW5V911_9LEPT|nr:glycosyltransferase family 39 protein [Leptospira soteropolitanensis]MCW7491349.1 glycosyltransferase family 39 protein [Leptospira soteropolitanensis]MCW7498934.1 glycosyltransferase family 39 protein [Leptospira soteropolitanensis]MCW7521474.1 glycosyltransferase family 39 protein [Leptospira soteropolitanensis]MCW7525037.1 glycosyltransferase family 39 protein [Leptospira soteropolitanensis]MCW7528905.1 glycosyltransferase family 39 protein [Leptospira soteropolitanensis]